MFNSIDKNLLIQENILKIGKVFSVQGRKIQVVVDSNRNLSNLFFQGNIIKNIAVNSYIKIMKGTLKIIGKIEGEYIDLISGSQPEPYSNQKDKFIRLLDVSMLGYFNSDNHFILGIQELPLVDNECYILDHIELQAIYTPPSSKATLTLGKSPLDNQIINIDVDKLFASHIGIFGNTGSGKSYTLAKLYNELFQKYKSNVSLQKTSKFILIDFNGEYIGEHTIIDSKYKTTYNLMAIVEQGTTHTFTRYPISSATINNIEILSLLFQAKSQTQVPFLKRVLEKEGYYNTHVFQNNNSIQQHIFGLMEKYFREEKKKQCLLDFISILNTFKNKNASQWPNIKQFFLFSIKPSLSEEEKKNNPAFPQQAVLLEKKYDQALHECLDSIKQYIEGFDFGNNKLKILELKIIIKYYDELLAGFSEEKHIGPLIKRIQAVIPDLNAVLEIKDSISYPATFLTIISLKHIDIKLKKFLPLLIAKEAYTYAKQGKIKFLNFIIDEAHNILSEESDRETEYWKDYRLETFEEIIKEGRKFGVFLTIASQRPADISPTILSQLHNYFLHRLVNDKDIYAIQKAIAYLDKVSFEYLPIMPIGTAIFAGTATSLPVIISIGKISNNFRPLNDTVTLSDLWK